DRAGKRRSGRGDRARQARPGRPAGSGRGRLPGRLRGGPPGRRRGRGALGEGGRLMDVVATDLRKRYGATVALDGLSLEFPSGRLSGFLGPNGAGKTTTFRILLGLSRPDAGTARVGDMSIDRDLARIVKRVGAIVDEPGLLRPLSGRQNLVVAAHTLGFGHDRIE